jgi:hypothetical protein
MPHTASKNSSRARPDNRFNSVPKLYPINLGTFWVALLVCSPKVLKLRDSDFVQVLRRVTLAAPYGNPVYLPLSNPTKCRKLGLLGLM